jgi:hypothetical protein
MVGLYLTAEAQSPQEIISSWSDFLSGEIRPNNLLEASIKNNVNVKGLQIEVSKMQGFKNKTLPLSKDFSFPSSQRKTKRYFSLRTLRLSVERSKYICFNCRSRQRRFCL